MALDLERLNASVYAVQARGQQETLLRAGSGVAIGPRQVVTTCNVLAGSRSIAVRRGNVSYGATLEAPDIERNLCLLTVADLNVPGVPLSPSAAPGFGQKVVAASVSGTALAVRTATIAGLQADAGGKLDRIEASVAPDAGAAGGGLFDESGRLMGILVSPASPKDARQQAVPASWIPEIRARGAAAMASYRVAATNLSSDLVPAREASAGSPSVGEVWRYQLHDDLTRKNQEVSYRVDRIDNGRVIYNQGSRIEFLDGRVDRIDVPIAGEFDLASPPGGWVPANVKVGDRWKVAYSRAKGRNDTSLEAVAEKEEMIRVPAGAYRAIRIAYRGYANRAANVNGMGSSAVPYRTTVWYAPELGRVVRFTAGYSNRWERLSETLELVEHRVD
ncbi:S1 family peptidase [Ralstonia sp. UBA689]|uniref:S1 family peptidase n=1 Tax=Ralstonia sp. UBA689 TaxID=1947373 RepID=UPI0025E0678D|nr:serine protease [Ralstonia sp. UBA689]